MKEARVNNLGGLLTRTARLFPSHYAVIAEEKNWTWKEVDQRVQAMASALKNLGIAKGDRILVLSRNNLQLFESSWVSFRMGCVWVPTNFRLTPPEVAHLASSSGAKVMLYQKGFEDHAKRVLEEADSLKFLICIGDDQGDHQDYESMMENHLGQEFKDETVEYDDPLWFFYTSGTTGRPKAGVLTHGQMNFVVNNHLADLIPGTTEKDVSIAVAPLSHGAGVHMLLNVARGASLVLMPGNKLDPELFWQLVERHRVSNLFTVPTIVKMLVEHESVDRYDHSSLRYMICAGAPMYRADQKKALEKLGQVMVQYYGMGEVTGCITYLPTEMHSMDDEDPNANIGSCGIPRTGMEIAILDSNLKSLKSGEVGEICCRGPAVCAGYHDNPDATEEAMEGGWFHTGDLGYVDERGLVYITGRSSDMYISGGANVYPREIEEVLLTHPGVSEVAVFGVPDEKWGETGVAIVVRNPHTEIADEAALYQHLEGRCARYRWPSRFFFWDNMPKSGYGKIVKKDLREMLKNQRML